MSSLARLVSLLGVGIVAPLVACGSHSFNNSQTSTALCTADAQCKARWETCDVAKQTCTRLTPGIELGTGDPASVTISEIHVVAKADFVDLAFNDLDPSELWVVNYKDDHTHVGRDVGPGAGTWRNMLDPAAMHFMHKPTAIAWGANGYWATCGDNDNSQNDPRGGGEANNFMGPALFTSDLSIFGKENPKINEGRGSHIDMLHNTSFCRGVAHVSDNWFWAFNGELGSLDKYNFATPHDPGADDHSDGEIYRYAQGQVKGVDGVPSHIAYDADDKFLYVADTGNKRIVRLDTSSGTLGSTLPRRNEVLVKNGVMNGTSVVPVVPPGVLEQPVGIEVRNDHVYVSDAATSRFYCFDKTGKEVRRFDTGLPPKSLAGFTFGPDNRLWFVDRIGGKVLRLDPIAK